MRRVVVAPDGSLFFVSSKDAPKRRLLRTPGTSPSLASAEVVLPQGDAVLSDVLPTRSRLYILEDTGGVSRLRSVPLTKGKAGSPAPVAAPPISAIGGLVAMGGGRRRIRGDDLHPANRVLPAPREGRRGHEDRAGRGVRG